MKRLFLSLSLLTMTAVYAQENASEVTPEQLEVQRALLEQAGAELEAKLLENPTLAGWFDNASDTDIEVFHAICVRYATLNMIANSQLTQHYDQIFGELSELTGQDNWLIQLSFASKTVQKEEESSKKEDASV